MTKQVTKMSPLSKTINNDQNNGIAWKCKQANDKSFAIELIQTHVPRLPRNIFELVVADRCFVE